jgi:ABC-2 type transport system ATP-binding protein
LFSIGFAEIPQVSANAIFDVIKQNDDHTLTVKIKEGHSTNAMLQHFLQSGANIVSFNEILPSLNEIFIRQVEGTPTARHFQTVTA